MKEFDNSSVNAFAFVGEGHFSQKRNSAVYRHHEKRCKERRTQCHKRTQTDKYQHQIEVNEPKKQDKEKNGTEKVVEPGDALLMVKCGFDTHRFQIVIVLCILAVHPQREFFKQFIDLLLHRFMGIVQTGYLLRSLDIGFCIAV